MPKKLHIFGLIVLMLCFWQCESTSPLGEDFVRSEILDVVFIDTINLRLSTVQIDSIVTSNTDRHLVGYRDDALLGSIQAQPYFQISNDSLLFPDEGAEYLFAELELFYDGYFYYDTAQDVSLTLYPLTEELELDEYDNVLYDFSSFDYDEENPVGQLTFAPRPRRRETINIPVNDDFAQVLFDFVDSDDQELFFDEFDERYPGFVLIPDTTITQSFLGFSTRSRLVIHYRESGEENEIIFPTNRLRFNQILNDRTGASLIGLTSRSDDVSSSETNQRAFLSNGVGTAIKVEIPSLGDIREVLTQNFITEAVLVLRPVRNTYGDFRPFPSEISVFEVDRLNRIERPLNVPQSLVVDDEFGEDTQFRITLTDFIQDKIEEEGDREDAILLQGSPTELSTTINQLVVGDSFSEFEASLELFVLDYIIDND
ncbi:MAG: DUF4270 family protein [Bacteroidota bacterium]